MASLLHLPQELLDLIVEQLELRDLLNLGFTCRSVYQRCPFDKLAGLVKHMSAPTRIKEQLAAQSPPWILSHALLILFRRCGPRKDLEILTRHGAVFHGVESVRLLREMLLRRGPGRYVLFLLKHGVDFSQIPGGINQLLRDYIFQEHWDGYTGFLRYHGASYAQMPGGVEMLISDLIRRNENKSHSKSGWYLKDRWRIDILLEEAGPLTYTPDNLARHLILVYNEFGITDRTRFLLEHIPDGITLLIVHQLKTCSKYNWLTLEKEVAPLLVWRASFLQTPALTPSGSDESAMLDALLRKLPDANSNERIWQALMLWAASRDRADIVETLVQRGVSIDETDVDHFTPLLIASHKGHSRVVEALLRAKPSEYVYEHENPLIIACAHGQKEIVEMLIQHGWDPNTCDGDGRVPLCIAALCENEELVKLLLRHGADPNLVAKPWKSISIHYLHTGAADVTLGLLSGPKIDEKKDQTPLRAASGNVEITKILLDHGADPNLPCNASPADTSLVVARVRLSKP